MASMFGIFCVCVPTCWSTRPKFHIATIPWYSPDYKAGRDFYFSLSPMSLYLHHIILSLV